MKLSKLGRLAALGAVLVMSCLLAPNAASAAPPKNYTYQLVQNRHSGLCMSFGFTQATCAHGPAVQIREIPANPHFVSLVSATVGGNLCLTVQNGSYANNARLIPAGCTFEPSQQFRKVDAPVAGFYQLIAQHSGKCVTIQSESLKPGAQVVQYDCPPAGQIDPIGAGYWSFQPSFTYNRVRNWHSGLCMSASPYVQTSCNDNTYQQWREIPDGFGNVHLTNLSASACLVVQNGSLANNAPLTAGQCIGQDYALFRKEPAPVGGGYYQLRNQRSGKCVTILSESVLMGAQLVQYTCPAIGQTDPIGAGYWITI